MAPNVHTHIFDVDGSRHIFEFVLVSVQFVDGRFGENDGPVGTLVAPIEFHDECGK